MNKTYYFDNNKRFVVEDYNKVRPFSNFMPGIAGLMGIPLWMYYVNRGQCVACFGTRDKDGAIMEFQPANKAYQIVNFKGFRTFIKVVGNSQTYFYEPFSSSESNKYSKQTMFISPNRLEIQDVNTHYGLKVNVSYTILPNEGFAALLRKVSIKNISDKAVNFEIIDGLPEVVPYGSDDSLLKDMCYTRTAWMGVTNIENNVPFYKLRATTNDIPAEDVEVKGCNFYMTFTCQDGQETLLKPIVDPDVLFESDTSLQRPVGFIEKPLKEVYKRPQIATNKMPCGFFGMDTYLESNQEVDLFSIIGNLTDLANAELRVRSIISKDYFESKFGEAARLTEKLTDTIETHTSSKLFDEYTGQTYLDNVLRGGLPIIFKGKNPAERQLFHVYTRKHGDLEREYNFFSQSPEFYSQGNGNYRDVNQNRRCDGLFNPDVYDNNIVFFMNLIQADGFNPLSVEGYSFRLPEDRIDIVHNVVEFTDDIADFFKEDFTPGKLIMFIERKKIKLKASVDEFLNVVLTNSEKSGKAVFGEEGYWIDHWTYNLDLIDTFISIFPDRIEELLFNNKSYTYYDSPEVVLPRTEKHLLVGSRVRQLHAVERNKEKVQLINSRSSNHNTVRIKNGKGEIYKTNLFSKLMCLVINKFASYDPFGLGMEMEANKPGWYDALNGLPGLFGSSTSEICELKRLIDFMLDSITNYNSNSVSLPEEVYSFMINVEKHAAAFNLKNIGVQDIEYWDKIENEKEAYRNSTMLGFDGSEKELGSTELQRILSTFKAKVDRGLEKALELGKGIMPAFFSYECTQYEIVKDEHGQPKFRKGNPCVLVKSFELCDMPIYLEGQVKAIKISDSVETARRIYNNVRSSELYDEKIKMYRVNGSIESQSYEIGKSRIYTPGWLENGSVWLHMEYKYMLEVIRKELYEEFYSDFKNVFIPFLDPTVYGRSVLENTSFIVSSSFPDETLHGAGFYARLSGSTVEYLSIWNVMFFGNKVFFLDENELCLRLKPSLPEWLFDNEGKVHIKFLGQCDVIYHNPYRRDTFKAGVGIKRMIITTEEEGYVEIEGCVLRQPYSDMVRNRKVKRIDAYLE